MEANELRIGNLIKSGEKIITVKNINLEGINFDFCCEQNAYEYSEIEPITLTEDLLLKSGFYKAQYLEHIFQININGLYFAFDEAFEGEKDENIVGDFDECVTIRIPKYLHQLQNLYFALTGKELEINF